MSFVTSRPKFMDSPYFVMEPGNWHLKTGAPEDVRKEFEQYKKNILQKSKQTSDAPTDKDE